MQLKLKNFARSYLSVAVNSAETSFIVALGHGSKFPPLATGEYFYITLKDAAETKREICKITSITGDVLVAERGVDGTTPQTWAVNDLVEMTVIAAMIPDQPLNSTSSPTFSSITLGTPSGISGSQIANTPAGNVASTTVQDAINELDGEKQTKVTATGILKGDGSGGVTAATGADAASLIGTNAVTNATNATKVVATNWTIQEVGGALYFQYGGVNKAKLDSTGKLTLVGDFTANNGTV